MASTKIFFDKQGILTVGKSRTPYPTLTRVEDFNFILATITHDHDTHKHILEVDSQNVGSFDDQRGALAYLGKNFLSEKAQKEVYALRPIEQHVKATHAKKADAVNNWALAYGKDGNK